LETFNKCDYGCENEGIYIFDNGKRCCSETYHKCPSSKEKQRQSHLGIKFSEEHKKNLSKAKKNSTPWNKGLKGCNVAWNKGKKTGPLKDITKQKLSKILSGPGNPNWKGGYSKDDIPYFDTYFDRLTVEEKPKRHTQDRNILTVICSYCKKRFTPKLTNVLDRIKSLNGKTWGENRLYCSKSCKDRCPVFGKELYQSNHPRMEDKYYTSYEYQIFREFVLKRDKNVCQFCGNLANEVHHEKPQKLQPFFSLDPDYAWSVCERCHQKFGHKQETECSYSNLSKVVCT